MFRHHSNAPVQAQEKLQFDEAQALAAGYQAVSGGDKIRELI